jgi:hypothetical protein
MANAFAEKPVLTPIVLPDMWECPITGLRVPKVPERNLAYRIRLLQAAEQDQDVQRDLYTACSQSILFWINTFVFTLRVFEAGEGGKVKQSDAKHLPFVTWPRQDVGILDIERCIDEGDSLLTDKSRDMGVTWMHIAVYTHRLLFRQYESHLMISRKEDACDSLDGLPKNYPFGTLSDPGTLFGKIDYILSRLPSWMLPRLLRKKLHIVNLDTKTRIDAESANATAGSSDRRTSIYLDEFAKVKEAEAIKQSTKDVTACRLVSSTPWGAGTAYSKWRMSGSIPVFVMPWWEHPEKGAGRYVVQDENGAWHIRSPWYDQYCATSTPKEVATELDMDHIGSGDTFFEAHILEQHKRLFSKPPRRHATIKFRSRLSDEDVVEAISRRSILKLSLNFATGPWSIWTHLIKGRPDQCYSYTLSIDISKGQGASNSIINVTCNETREKIAEFADANTPPYELARITCAAAIWVGGRNRRPLIIWENNGDPGMDFGRQLCRTYKYPYVYFRRQSGTLSEKSGKRYGWRSDTEAKATALGLLRRAYAHGKYINRSAAALDEALTYIRYDDGGIGPAELVAESASARKTHGDRVIADMLAVLALSEMPKWRDMERVVPQRSFGHRLAEWKKRRKLETQEGGARYPKRFNFAELQSA